MNCNPNESAMVFSTPEPFKINGNVVWVLTVNKYGTWTIDTHIADPIHPGHFFDGVNDCYLRPLRSGEPVEESIQAIRQIMSPQKHWEEY